MRIYKVIQYDFLQSESVLIEFIKLLSSMGTQQITTEINLDILLFILTQGSEKEIFQPGYQSIPVFVEDISEEFPRIH